MLLQLVQRNADYRPDATAIVYGAETVSNLALLTSIECCARGLLSLGVEPGDKVALLLENSPDFITSFFGVAACRAVNVPLNLEYKPEEVAFYFTDARVKLVIVDQKHVALAKAAAAETPHPIRIIVRGTALDGSLTLAQLSSLGSNEPLPSPALDDDVVFIYSSGSTGRPKCAPRTLEQYWWEMDDVIECLGLGHEDVIFCAIPMFHNFGAVQCMLTSVGSGAKLVILKDRNPFALRRNEALRLLERHRVTIFPCVPFMFGHLAASTIDADLSSIRVCYSAAAALTRDIAERFFEKFGIPIRQHYGCTEVGAMTIDLDEEPSAFGQSVGTAFPGVDIRILDEAGQELPRGAVGEVVVRSRQMTRGYLGMDEVNRELFRNGCFYTGDLGRLDDQGRLYLLGRKKFVIDVVGQKVSPIEIEDVLVQHGSVSAAVVIGVDGGAGKDAIVRAYVLANRQCSVDEILAFCRERLANFKVPSEVLFIDSIPKDTLGKILRKQDVLDCNVVSTIAQPALEDAV